MIILCDIRLELKYIRRACIWYNVFMIIWKYDTFESFNNWKNREMRYLKSMKKLNTQKDLLYWIINIKLLIIIN